MNTEKANDKPKKDKSKNKPKTIKERMADHILKKTQEEAEKFMKETGQGKY